MAEDQSPSKKPGEVEELEPPTHVARFEQDWHSVMSSVAATFAGGAAPRTPLARPAGGTQGGAAAARP